MKVKELRGLQDTKSKVKEEGKQAWACDEGDMDPKWETNWDGLENREED